MPALEADLQRLAVLYAWAVYARSGLPANSVALLQQFWLRLEAVAEQPLSAWVVGAGCRNFLVK